MITAVIVIVSILAYMGVGSLAFRRGVRRSIEWWGDSSYRSHKGDAFMWGVAHFFWWPLIVPMTAVLDWKERLIEDSELFKTESEKERERLNRKRELDREIKVAEEEIRRYDRRMKELSGDSSIAEYVPPRSSKLVRASVTTIEEAIREANPDMDQITLNEAVWRYKRRDARESKS